MGPEVVCLTTGSFQQNGYLIADHEARHAVVVDPGEEATVFVERLRTEGWEAQAIWLTHAHLDHIAGVAHLVDELGLEVWLHPADRGLYDQATVQAALFGVPFVSPPPPDHEIVPGATMTVGRYDFAVRLVPGHSPGSVAWVGHGLAVVGDALFAGSVGRVDLPGGDGPTLLASITNELLTLPDETVVYSGHGAATTIGRERASNPFLNGAFPLG